MADGNSEIQFDFAIDENKLREAANALKTRDQLLHLQRLRDEFNVDISAGELLVGNEFNEWLDNENPIANLSYSKALFDQDPVAYEQELENYLDAKETVSENV